MVVSALRTGGKTAPYQGDQAVVSAMSQLADEIEATGTPRRRFMFGATVNIEEVRQLATELGVLEKLEEAGIRGSALTGLLKRCTKAVIVGETVEDMKLKRSGPAEEGRQGATNEVGPPTQRGQFGTFRRR